VYLDFPPVKLNYPGLVLRRFCAPYLDLIDRHVVGDLRRLIRIPYTLNTKGQMLSSMVVGKITTSVIRLEEVGFEGPVNEGVPERLKGLDTLIEERTIEPREIMASQEPFPPCIANILNKIAETGDVSHAERLHLTAYLMWRGYHPEEIHLLFQEADDYDPHYTEYQIKSVFNARLRCYTCIRSRELEICPLEDLDRLSCPWYPSINTFLMENKNGGRN
jgi:DNA primase large subunit